VATGSRAPRRVTSAAGRKCWRWTSQGHPEGDAVAGVDRGTRLHIYTRLHFFAPNFAPGKTSLCPRSWNQTRILRNPMYLCTTAGFMDTRGEIPLLRPGSPFPGSGANEHSDQYTSLYISLFDTTITTRPGIFFICTFPEFWCKCGAKV
jgi:hypothetical protein